MVQRVLGIAAKIATPISLASLSVIAFYLIYQAIIGLHILGDLTGSQTSELLNSIADKVFYLAIVLSTISIPAYLFVKQLSVVGQRMTPQTITGNVLSSHGHPIAKAIVFVEGVDRR
jgi:hypothetical protein